MASIDVLTKLISRIRGPAIPFILIALAPWYIFFKHLGTIRDFLDGDDGLLVILIIVGIFATFTILCIILLRHDNKSIEASLTEAQSDHYLNKNEIEKEFDRANRLGRK